ncbi:MAG: hypothetical protein Q9210_000474 [Variospora velana]
MPHALVGYQKDFDDFAAQCRTLCMQLLRLFALGLKRPSQPGLEILGPNREWRSVPVWPSGTEQVPFPPILVNVGDLLSYWTNGFLKSTVHRVVFPPDNEKADRYSIAYFFHPSNETRLTAVPSDLIHQANAFSDKQQEEVTGLKVVTAEEHLRRRLAATYGWDHQSEAVD